MKNHLRNESSPYLLQHADNPVDWYPWGAEALERARRDNKPIFLSIGYAACHWCHVMAHESFEDPITAELMNANFINIKVDREERPDLDSIYMNFVVALNGQGGWPMSVFLTPEGKPFYGGTYFPPVRQQNIPAFRDVLEAIARLWQTDRSELLKSSDNLANQLQAASVSRSASGQITLDLLNQAVQTIAKSYDWQKGGWGTAPKFPQPMLIEFLLCQATRGDQASLAMAVHALKSMAQGGMYDVLGGGFSRYSVDETWFIPHFEKMLYDNAQLARCYLHAYLLTGKLIFKHICETTLDFVMREMTHRDGGFYSSLDADSEGEEGKFYLWTPAEIRAILIDEQETALFTAAYGVSETGNFDGRNILRRVLTDEQLGQQFQLDPLMISERLADARGRLLVKRNSRVRPGTDDKVLVAWNALMLTTFAEAGMALDRQVYTQYAIHNADFMLDNIFNNDKLMRSWRDGIARHPAYLEDYAGLSMGLLSLYQSDPNPRWYQASIGLVEYILAHFGDPASGFFDTSDEHEPLLYRPKDLQDNATPSANALAALALLQLAAFEGRSDWRELAEHMLMQNQGLIQRYPTAFARWLCAADFAIGPVNEVAIVGNLSDDVAGEMLQLIWHSYQPRMVLAASEYPSPAGSPALLNDRPLLNGKTTAYVCRNFTCQQPVNDPVAMQVQLHQ